MVRSHNSASRRCRQYERSCARASRFNERREGRHTDGELLSASAYDVVAPDCNEV